MENFELLKEVSNKYPDYQGSKNCWPWNKEVNETIYNSDVNWPKISIVTPSFNQSDYLEETIRSILLQNYPNLEYIIIDGGSTDNSVEIIRKYEAWITYWVSEKDGGQANAINKGLHVATGTVFNFINSDDYLTAGALKSIGEGFLSDIDLLAGWVINFDDRNNEEVDETSSIIIKNSNLSMVNYYCTSNFHFHQPGVWFKRSLLNEHPLSEDFHYAFDTELILNVLYDNPQILYIDTVLVNFRLHESSKSVSQYDKFVEDLNVLHLKHSKSINPEISVMALQYLEQKKWRADLDKLRTSSASKISRSIKLFIGILVSPTSRLDRFSLGCLKKIILD